MKINNFGMARLRQISVAVLAATTVFAPLAHAQTVTYSYQKYVEGLPSEVPAGGASPSLLDFGEVQMPDVSPWKTVTYSNLGNTTLSIGGATAPAGFEVQNGCPSSLLAKQSCAMQVRFVPGAPGAAAGMLTIDSDSYSSPDLVALAAVATQPVASFTPNPVNLGEVDVGQTSPVVSLGVTNTGTGVLQLSSLTFGGAAQGFTVTEGSCGPLPRLLGNQEGCAMTVSVTPNATGPLAGGVVSVVTNDAAGTHAIPLQATGVQAGLALAPAALTFGDVLVGSTSTPQTITVSNPGTGNLQVATITRTGAASDQFTSSNTCGGVVSPGGSCAITVTAAPTAKGAKTASLELVSNAPTSPTAASLTVNATQGTATLDPDTWSFGTVIVGP
jgi:hypothetical protein